MCETVTKMQSLGMEALSQRLNHKKFPQKFLRNIAAFASALDKAPHTVPRPLDEATTAQLGYLRDKGFTDECLAGLRKGEASTMIAAMMNMKDEWRTRPGVLPSGKYAGRHVSETTWYYRQAILSKQPQSEIAQIIREWEKQGGRYKKGGKR